jgi:phage terminase large subunit
MQVARNVGLSLTAKVGAKFAPLYQPFRHKALYGGRGSGKSHGVGEALVIQSSQRTLRIVGARQYQNSIRDSSKTLIEQKIAKLGLANQFWIGKTEIVNTRTESRFTFIGLERNPDSARSLEGCDICWVEEARNISAKSIKTLVPTVRKPGSEIWWTWNPVNPDDPIEKLFRTGEAIPQRSYIAQINYHDNPWFYRTEMPAEMLRAIRENYKLYQHVWLGDYDNALETRIFKNVEIGTIVVPDHIAPQFGMDFGFAADPSAVIKLYVIPEAHVIYIADERFGHVSLLDLGDMVREIPQTEDFAIIADSSRPDTIDLLASEGLPIVGAIKGPGSIEAGIEWLRGFKIIINPRCEHMIKESREYTWQVDRRTDKILNKPVGVFNHGWDAIRYATEQNRGAGVRVSM